MNIEQRRAGSSNNENEHEKEILLLLFIFFAVELALTMMYIVDDFVHNKLKQKQKRTHTSSVYVGALCIRTLLFFNKY